MHNKFFAIGLAVSFVITGGFLGWQQIQLNEKYSADDEVIESPAEEPVPEIQEEPGIPAETADYNDVLPEEDEPVTTTSAAVTADIVTEGLDTVPEENAEAPALPAGKGLNAHTAPEFIQVDTSYFEDALFIGDSRMVGIKEYGGLSEPTYFAYTGLSSFGLYKKDLEVKGIGEISFEDLISTRSFGKIYIMLGINEAGSKLSEFQAQYDSIVQDIKAKQPGALIFLCSNLHVTKYKSEHDSIFANSHIDEINGVIETIALKNGAYYLDVNPLFDDGEGNLSTDYAADYAHMYGRCYLTWIDWLCTKGIAVKKDINESAY